MHISLDSALGSPHRLNPVGESVLQIAPAAAAYSLRSLTGGDPNVVRVRRESDNTEKDFSGSQIESGEMARWVTAANDTVNGYVQTWYDQSGNGNDAEQSAASSQPKIVGEVTSGEPHAFLGAIEFDGSQQFQTITLTSSSQPNSIFSVSNTNVAGQTRGIYGTNANQVSYYRSTNNHAIYSSGTGAAILEGSAYVVDTDYLRFDLFNGANSAVGVNGTITSGTTGDAALNRLDIGDPAGGWNPLNGGIKELILYTDDQSSNRTAIETNIANQYGITLS